MKTLFIIPYIPYPLDSGGSQAFFSMVENLEHDNDIHIIFPGTCHDADRIRDLEDIWKNVTFYPYFYAKDEKPVDFGGLYMSEEEKQYYHSSFLSHVFNFYDSLKRKVARYRRHHIIYDDCSALARRCSLLTNRDYYLTEGFVRHVENISHREKYDFIQVEFYEFLPLYMILPKDSFKIFVHHELRFIRLDNELGLFRDPTLSEKLQVERIRLTELSMLDKYDIIITLTDTDKKILVGQHIDSNKIRVSPATITYDGIQKHEFKKCGLDFVFVGNNNHFPNYDGVTWLCVEVLPYLRKLSSEFRIHVVGKWDKRISDLYKKKYPEISFEGFVGDLHAYLNGKISIVPIRIGSGMRMKILDAVNSFSPVITTSKGIEGQDFYDGEDCMIVDDPEQFANAMISLAKDKDLQRKFTENASIKLVRIYPKDKMLQIRSGIYSEIFRKISAIDE